MHFKDALMAFRSGAFKARGRGTDGMAHRRRRLRLEALAGTPGERDDVRDLEIFHSNLLGSGQSLSRQVKQLVQFLRAVEGSASRGISGPDPGGLAWVPWVPVEVAKLWCAERLLYA